MITDAQIRRMFPNAGARLDPHLPFIGPALAEFKLDVPKRAAAFLAQAAEESGEYRYMHEIASGEEYEGRADLGNIQPGDGVRFKGGGPFQITGRANYFACSAALGVDLIASPEKIQEPQYATASACWYWGTRSLSKLADVDWFREITRRINGGYNGLSERVAYWARNRMILGLDPVDIDTEVGRVIDFQAAHGLTADGIVGPKTMEALT